MPNDTAFQMAASNIRFGAGTTREVGMDLADLAVKKTLVVIDPAVGPGFDDSSLRPVTAATLVIGSVQNDFLPFAYHAGRYAELLPGADVVRLDSGEGHFVYLDECSQPIEVMGVPLCSDREGVDRGEVHARLTQVNESFFSRHLMGEIPLEDS